MIDFVDRAIATVTEAAGPCRDEWSSYDHDIINQARDADAKVERLSELLSKWVAYCDFAGTKPVSGDVRDNPVLQLIKDSRAALQFREGDHT